MIVVTDGWKLPSAFPDRWKVGPYFAHHLASCTPLHSYVTLHVEMLLIHFLLIWTLKDAFYGFREKSCKSL